MLNKHNAKNYFAFQLTGTDEKRDWKLIWAANLDILEQEEHFDGVILLRTNVSQERLSAGDVVKKYKEQVSIEQTFDFIKSPFSTPWPLSQILYDRGWRKIGYLAGITAIPQEPI